MEKIGPESGNQEGTLEARKMTVGEAQDLLLDLLADDYESPEEVKEVLNGVNEILEFLPENDASKLTSLLARLAMRGMGFERKGIRLVH